MFVGGSRVVTLAFDPSVAAIDLRYDIEYSTNGGQTWKSACPRRPPAPSQVTLVRTGRPVIYRENSPSSAPWIRLKVSTINGSFTSFAIPLAKDYVTWQTQNSPGNSNNATIGPDSEPMLTASPTCSNSLSAVIPTAPPAVPSPTSAPLLLVGSNALRSASIHLSLKVSSKLCRQAMI
ncbi:MAG: hypothetical protein N2035_08920 [Chthoniobacterales bacterium]|nr:hypothetical protein [Chthoniobacterales bacterium]